MRGSTPDQGPGRALRLPQSPSSDGMKPPGWIETPLLIAWDSRPPAPGEAAFRGWGDGREARLFEVEGTTHT